MDWLQDSPKLKHKLTVYLSAGLALENVITLTLVNTGTCFELHVSAHLH